MQARPLLAHSNIFHAPPVSTPLTQHNTREEKKTRMSFQLRDGVSLSRTCILGVKLEHYFGLEDILYSLLIFTGKCLCLSNLVSFSV